MSALTLTASEEASLLEGLRNIRRADAADMAPPLGLSFASRLRTLGMHREAAEVEAMVARVYQIAVEVA